MGSGQSSDKLHCNRYLDGKGPRPLSQQATYDMKGKNRGLNDCQPEGHMTWMILPRDLPGFPEDHTLHVDFTFPDGIQTECRVMKPLHQKHVGSRLTHVSSCRRNSPTLAGPTRGCSAPLTCPTTGTAGRFCSSWTRLSCSSSCLPSPPMQTDRTPSPQLPSPLKREQTKALTDIQTVTTWRR
uniref:Uncharacterized protein n=1 Tax=Gasterosteus aculeatus TaxID=69293 RepID=G3NA18_GASAC